MFTDSLTVWKFPKGMVENWIRELWLSVLAVCVWFIEAFSMD